MGPVRILVVEDDPNLGFLLHEQLELQGYEVRLCADGEAGLHAFRKERFDLCVLDIMLPKKDGFHLAREARASDRQIPIIFLTARSLKEDRIEGLKLGADDYVTKPFSLEELILRIQAVLRRTMPASTPDEHVGDIFRIGRFAFNFEAQTLQADQQQRRLTAKEAELLRLLCLHRNDVLDRRLALKTIWGEDTYFNSRSMDVFVSKLRKYLGSDSRIEIRNVHGRGFKLVVADPST